MKRVPNGVTVHRWEGRLLRRTLSIAVVFAMALVGTSLFSLGALAAPAPYAYSNGFENVNDTSPPAPNTSTEAVIGATRTASGTAGITAASGAWYGQAATDSGAFTRLGGYSSTFPTGGYTTSVNIYLDMAAAATPDLRFDWDSAISTPSGTFRRDFVFNAGTNGIGFVIAGSNNAGRSGANPFVAADQFLVTTTGWYTFEHTFYDGGAGVLAADLNLRDDSGNLLHKWTLSDPTDIIGSTVGGNRYAWLVNNELPLALDNVTRSGIASADLSITKTDSPDPVHIGQKLTYTIVVTNNGPDGATGVTLQDDFPKTTGFGSVSSTQGSCSRSKTRVTCILGTMASGSTATVTLVVKPTQKGTITNTVTVSATSPADPNTANNTATQNTLVKP
jgi:uncharacterized repeat protein (TIGR01451 family)